MPRRAAPPPDMSFMVGPARPATTIFADAVATQVAPRLLAPGVLDDNPYQPRETMNPEQLEELAAVIRAHGFQGALVARPHPELPDRYQLAFGHRRREAAKVVGLTSLPVQVVPLDDHRMIELAITENIQREDLDPLAEGRTYQLMEDQLGYTHEQIATAVGKKRGYIENRLRLTRAPAEVQELVAEKPDSLRAAADLSKIEDPAARADLIAGLREGTITTNDVASYRRAAQPPAPPAPVLARAPSAAVAPRPTAPPVIRSAGPGDRGRLVRLETALQSLVAYRQQASAARDRLTPDEYTKLAELRVVIEELCETYPAPEEA